MTCPLLLHPGEDPLRTSFHPSSKKGCAKTLPRLIPIFIDLPACLADTQLKAGVFMQFALKIIVMKSRVKPNGLTTTHQGARIKVRPRVQPDAETSSIVLEVSLSFGFTHRDHRLM